MKVVIALVVLAVVACVSTALSYPKSDDEENHLWSQVTDELSPEHTERVKRATCDLFSFSSKWVTPNHAACAAHCIARGNRGGRCRNQICHCRK